MLRNLGGKLMGIFDPISIKVPESIYSALERAGIIEDPLVKMNSLKAEWVAERWCKFIRHAMRLYKRRT